ncbi:MAG TPA: ABC transporter ATP-binding protein [Flavobacteriales bacterium]|nr:ABC transporter ATP-binding protein [Flavobacteriales bacterium]
MIQLNQVSVYFGGQTLLDDVTFMVNKGERVGLVGRNGAGKSTLLNIMSGDLAPKGGSISTSKSYTIAYLTQDLDFTDGKTVIEETLSAFKKVVSLQKEIHAAHEALANRTDAESESYMELVTSIGEMEESFIQHNGYNLEAECSKVLQGLGFLVDEFDSQTNTFSGGWRMRIELAKILLQKPDCILLDEPTNHLDIESIIWLEQWLKNYGGSVVLVSHDRTFLDAVTNRTIEIVTGQIYDYKASYSKYMQLREERQTIQTQAKKNQDQQIKQTEKLIDKFRYKASKAAFAQTLIKKLDKLDRVEVDATDESAMRFRFPPAPHSGKVTIEAKNIYKNYDSLEVLKDVSLSVDRGEKIAFVGKNGEGKTTLARVLAGTLDFKGNMKLGHLVKVGYYAQNQSDLLEDRLTVLEAVDASAAEQTSSQVRALLGSFLFSGDTVEKKISVLSGGERARVALCKLLLNPISLLIMDEPTNHLDMRSKDILKQALIKYDGTLIIVSHDRDFLRSLTGKVYEFKHRQIKEYIGDVTAFLETRHVGDLKALELANLKAKSTTTKEVSEHQMDYKANKQWQKDHRKARNKSGKLEKAIDDLEKELKQHDEDLQDPAKFKEISSEPGFFDSYEAKQKELAQLMTEWEAAVQDLDRLEKENKPDINFT